MKVADRVAIVTGGGGGIGGALAEELAAHGARVVVADLARRECASPSPTRSTPQSPGSAVAAGADVSDTESIRGLIILAESEFGPVDLYFANAGIVGVPGLEASEAEWERSIDVNLRAHIRAAQLLIPGWVGSRRGLLRQHRVGRRVAHPDRIGDLLRHQARRRRIRRMAAISYGDQGVRVSCLCPMGVNTELLYAGEKTGDPRGIAATRAVTSAPARCSNPHRSPATSSPLSMRNAS